MCLPRYALIMFDIFSSTQIWNTTQNKGSNIEKSIADGPSFTNCQKITSEWSVLLTLSQSKRHIWYGFQHYQAFSKLKSVCGKLMQRDYLNFVRSTEHFVIFFQFVNSKRKQKRFRQKSLIMYRLASRV